MLHILVGVGICFVSPEEDGAPRPSEGDARPSRAETEVLHEQSTTSYLMIRSYNDIDYI